MTLKNLLIAASLWVGIYPVFAQKDSINILEPILIDKSTLSGIGLEKIDLNDQPGREFFQKNLYRGEDLSVYVVSSQSWPGRMDNFAIDEYIFMLNGKARVKPDGGEDHFFQTGEHFFAPKGYTGEWEIIAGENYHYELSVITTPRADSVSLSRNMLPQLLDKNQLSGIDISLGEHGTFEKELIKGDELNLFLRGEKPLTLELSDAIEQIICLLSGQVSISTPGRTAQTFYSGDYFILPKGYTGTWESEGHGLIKYLVIKQTR